MHDISFASGIEIVHAQNVIAVLEEQITKMRTYKTCTACHYNPF